MSNNLDAKKVLVAVSGGVDSGSTSVILKEQGYDVACCILKMHEFSNPALEDAQRICDKIGLELIVKDVSKEFSEIVKEDFYQEYMQGRTPNPCVLCNRRLKFKTLVDVADARGIKWLATGHYAKCLFNEETQRYTLHKATDIHKDQTYMLWRLQQDVLERVMFPIGEYISKSDVRAYAKENELPIYDKDDSQDICFIKGEDYRDYITKYCASKNELDLIKSGDIILDGEIIGQHNGHPYYTIGQRRGLGIAYKKPIYVKRIDIEKNIIEVATEENIYSKGLVADSVNIIKYNHSLPEKKYVVKIRYKDIGKSAVCRLEKNENKKERLLVEFLEPRASIALGQSVVIYDENEIIGGGVIASIF